MIIAGLLKSEVASYDTPVKLVFEIMLSKVLYFIFVFVLLRLIKETNNKVKVPKSFYVHPIILTLSIGSFWFISAREYIEQTHQIILIAVSVSLFISIIFLFFAYQINAKKENQIIMLQQEQNKIKTDISYYEILEKQNADLRIYAHDAKKHLSAIRSLNENPEIEKYISEMIENLKKYKSNHQSGNKILDVLIDKYSAECEINNISFNIDVKNNNLIGLEYHDTVSILGNLLDNAVEAAVNSKEKLISFETDYRNNYSVIIISNSCDDKPLFDQDNTPITTKKNNLLHGVGLRSVRKTIIKYDGDMEIEYDDAQKMFISTLMLNLDNKIKVTDN